jgi:hypothetical protein
VLVILSERVGVVGAKFDEEAARAKGYDIEALLLGGFIGESSPTTTRKTTKVSKKDNLEKD